MVPPPFHISLTSGEARWVSVGGEIHEVFDDIGWSESKLILLSMAKNLSLMCGIFKLDDMISFRY